MPAFYERRPEDMAKRINVKLIMELSAGGLTQNEIANSRHFSKSSVSLVLKTAKTLDVTVEDLREMSEEDIYHLFFPDKLTADQLYELPDYNYVHEELKKVGVTLKLLWEEYRDGCLERGTLPVGKTKFCDDYNTYCDERAISGHYEHKPGQRCEVDWSGPTMKIIRDDGEEITVYLFVSCLSYSRYAYVEPTLDMKMDTWLRCHIHMYEYFEGVPVRTVCDNLKTGVTKHPKEGEIILTDAYEALGNHYITAIMPAGVKKPKQKPGAEGTVGNIATAIIAKLRHKTFHDFPSLEKAVKEALRDYNAVPFEKREGSRLEVWAEERSYLRSLPSVPYEIASWEYHRKVYPNCHATLKKNFYSVPYNFRGKYVDIRYTEKIVEIYCDHQRIASHPKFPDYVENRYRTEASHMPDYFNQPEMNDVRMLSWASTIGPNTKEVIARVFRSVQLKEQGYNAALAILRLSRGYPKDRFDTACRVALEMASSPRYRLIRSILTNNQDIVRTEQESMPKENFQEEENAGAFVRGASYYGGGGPDAE